MAIAGCAPVIEISPGPLRELVGWDDIALEESVYVLEDVAMRVDERLRDHEAQLPQDVSLASEDIEPEERVLLQSKKRAGTHPRQQTPPADQDTEQMDR